MKHDYIAAAFHILLVVVVYGLYATYPGYAMPVPMFGMMTYAAGFAYGMAGVLALRDYIKAPVQSKFNMAVLMIVVGGLLFIAESIGNAGNP